MFRWRQILRGDNPCVTVDEILSHFGQRKANAQEKCSAFVQAGIGNLLIWDDLQAQSLLGVEGFAHGLRHLVTEKQQIRRATEFGEAIFNEKPGKTSRDRLVAEAWSAQRPKGGFSRQKSKCKDSRSVPWNNGIYF
jgi:hypothetical protein